MKVLRVTHTLATILKIYAAFMLVPAAASLWWDESVPTAAFLDPYGVSLKETTVAYLLNFLLVLFLGLLLSALGRPDNQDLREREAFFIVGAGWLLLAVLGAFPFLLTRATASPGVAFYEAMSALTTTGFSALSVPLEQYPASTHVWRATLHLFGGLGIVLVLFAVVGRLTGGAFRLMGGESTGELSRLRPTLSSTAKSLLGIYLSINAATFLALWAAFRWTVEGMTWKGAALEAFVHAAGTVATGGMSTRSDSVLAFHSSTVNWIIGAGMLVGSTSFVLYYQALHGHGLRAFWHSTSFRFFVGLIALSGLVVAGYLYFDQFSVADALAMGYFAVITSIATCGYTAMDANLLPDGAKLIALFLMITGGMVGSTSGALKLDRIQTLFQLTFREIQKLLHPHAVAVVKVGGRILPEETMRRVVVFFFSYLTVFIAGALGFALLNFDLSTSLVASAASLGGVGYGWGGVTLGFQEHMPEVARLLSALLMWLGRLEIFTVLVLFLPATYRE